MEIEVIDNGKYCKVYVDNIYYCKLYTDELDGHNYIRFCQKIREITIREYKEIQRIVDRWLLLKGIKSIKEKINSENDDREFNKSMCLSKRKGRKLTPFDVFAIRKDMGTPKEISRKYNVSSTRILQIQRRYAWKWLPDEDSISESQLEKLYHAEGKKTHI